MAVIGESSAQLALRDPDIRLMLRVRDDDAGAFEELVDAYRHRLVGVMHHLIGNAEEAEDLAQEVFLRVYRARKKYRPRSKFCKTASRRRSRTFLTLPLSLPLAGQRGSRPRNWRKAKFLLLRKCSSLWRWVARLRW